MIKARGFRQKLNSIVNDRLTARLHVGEKRGFNLHVGVILRPLVLALNGA